MKDIAADKAVWDGVRRALEEDIGPGDVTSLALVPEQATCRAAILARHPVTVSGGPVAALCFRETDPGLICETLVPDGETAAAGQTLLTVSGSARSILTAERTALNFMQRMTGVATVTRRFAEIAGRYGVAVLDTRKTAPGLRALDKYAVLCGGGVNHRMGLHDRFLIKDNHRALWAGSGRKSLAEAVRHCRNTFPGLAIEMEVETEAELADALEGAPDWILLDNMTPEIMRRCVALCKGRSRLEASGGITLETVEAVAQTGVDAISLGCLTHSPIAADLTLEIEQDGEGA